MTTLSPQEATIAKALLDARQSGHLADPKTTPVASDPASAMRIQADVVRQVDSEISGWKVGIAENTPFAAPLLGKVSLNAPARWVQKSDTEFRIEVEIGVRLAKDLPPRPGKPYTREEITAAIDTVFCGIEMLGSRYSDYSNLAFLQGLSDCMHNGGYILGQEKKTQTIPGPLNEMKCICTLDGNEIFNGAPKHPQDDILLPLIEYASAQNDQLGGLKAGHIITTGALCGVLVTRTAGQFVASITGFEDMVVDFAYA
ncbi:hypothetical protein WJT86_04330 [Microvirga sp. W0021]|uniref:2-keto-4-pentenoate hydratase n=1 Tax=Hohaiivirga grylli TaxID=3133970 RepID=A0ABV0BH48_9HYPH